MREQGKPQAPRGMICPLLRKDVSKVCHNCELYQVIRFDVMQGAEAVRGPEVWGCAYNHALLYQRDMIGGLRGSQAATESFRNTAWAESQRNLTDMIATVQHENKVVGETWRGIREGLQMLAGAVAQLGALPAPEAAKQIDHNPARPSGGNCVVHQGGHCPNWGDDTNCGCREKRQ